MGNHVFMCYADADSDFVLPLAKNLKARGVPVWLDKLDISPKEDWDQAIDQAINECSDFLIVLSPTSVKSKEVRGELRLALDENKPILPVLYRPCRIPRQLRTIQYVDFTSCRPDDDTTLAKLLRALGTAEPVARQEETRKEEPPPPEKAEQKPPIPQQDHRQADPTANNRQFWSLPYGEPEWITVPAGEFWMGSAQGARNEKPVHRLLVPEFRIARTPVTNAQYQLYVQATGAAPPQHWKDGQPPKEKLAHPVVYITWQDAGAYCEWLSSVTGKKVRLPTEAEWEKAARGDQDRREYPWGDQFNKTKCNSAESGIGETSPVGAFPTGASPYGCLDMSGNVWEWVQDWYDADYYGPTRNPKGPVSGEYRIVRGGSWSDTPRLVRVSFRGRYIPDPRSDLVGFRCAQ